MVKEPPSTLFSTSLKKLLLSRSRLPTEREASSFSKYAARLCAVLTLQLIISSRLLTTPCSPDKHPDNPKAAKRFEQLGLVNKILRDARKDRYDHFLNTGFPKWRGTGYFYERFRPGLGSVIAGVILFTALLELLVRRLNYIRDSVRLSNIRVNAFYQAWGPKFYHVLYKAPGAPSAPAEKRIKLSLGSLLDLPAIPEQHSAGSTPDVDALEKEVRKIAAQGSNSSQLVASGRTTIDVLVTREDDGEGIVWTLDDETGEWTELTLNNIQIPNLANSWPVRAVQALIKRLTAGSTPSDASDIPAVPADAQDGSKSTGTDVGNGHAKSRKNNKKR